MVMSRAGLWAAGTYLVLAGSVAMWEGTRVYSGGFISIPEFRNIGSLVMTLPVGLPLALVGVKPDLGNPYVCGLLILLTAAIVYLVVARLAGRIS